MLFNRFKYLVIFNVIFLCVQSRNVNENYLQSSSLISSVNINAQGPQGTSCGYASCAETKKDHLNVHIVAHTHDDVGWLKTVDQYYYGLKSEIQLAGVQYILDSVISELSKDPLKKFIYVETAFFWMWWKKQDESTKQEVKRLVNNGQLEFTGGSWSMNDEAVTNYQSIIDQFTWGVRKLNETFGWCGIPHIGWQIDPFGHSREMASLFAQMGYDGLFFGRLDCQDKAQRKKSKTLEMVWQGSPDNLGKSSDLFTHVLYHDYSPPPGFCFDIQCSDVIVDDPESAEYNVEKKTIEFQQFCEEQSTHYTTNNILITMGSDFHFQQAIANFRSIDKLIRYVNSHPQGSVPLNVFYSTPTCYLRAVWAEHLTYTTKNDDFFPYKSDKNSYWSGYFTSRPAIKYYERIGNNFLQVCKQLFSLTDLPQSAQYDLDFLREAMGMMQHHDAITGTEKQLVAYDYARILSEAIDQCELISQTALHKLLPKSHNNTNTPLFTVKTCSLLNITMCETSESAESFILTVYNPLGIPISKYIRLPVKSGSSYTVLNNYGENVITQLVPVPSPVLQIPGRNSSSTVELVFSATDVPPLGFISYYISQSSNESDSNTASVIESTDDMIGSENLGLKINRSKGSEFVILKNGQESKLIQNFYYYRSMEGNNTEDIYRASGAYIFRPNGTAQLVSPDEPKIHVYKGVLVQEIHQEFNKWVSQVIRLYNGSEHIEFQWLVGPLPNDGIGREIVSRFDIPSINSGDTFYTDSNGREIIQRIRNYRPSFTLEEYENISGNYYPVTSRIYISDSNSRMAVLTDRAQGASSLKSGQIELMVHRRIFEDDAFGVGEALNETAYGEGLVVRGQHYLTFGSIEEQPRVERLLALKSLLNPWLFFSPVSSSFSEWRNYFNMEYSGLKQKLPLNGHLLTLEPWNDHSLLIRFEHIFEKSEDQALSDDSHINLQDLFAPFTITEIQEVSLAVSRWGYASISERMQFNSEGNDVNENENLSLNRVDINNITLTPMQIRTFILRIEYNK